jgi:hypothetical protein
VTILTTAVYVLIDHAGGCGVEYKLDPRDRGYAAIGFHNKFVVYLINWASDEIPRVQEMAKEVRGHVHRTPFWK